MSYKVNPSVIPSFTDETKSNRTNNITRVVLSFPLTGLKGEVVHHLQPTHHQQIWLEV